VPSAAQQEGNTLSSPSTPTAAQLAAARRIHWRHNADPILTINMLRDWLNASGLVLFHPRAAQLPAPAPTFIEVILGAPTPAPSLAETEQPRALLTHLVHDSGAIPLNLLGSTIGSTETPDFLVSPLAFSYIFTLRGDKAWKQPPSTSGATKVSPLALNTYNLLVEHAKDHPAGISAPGLSASALATQLGKEVTEKAVLRALNELWQHLRVIPVPQHDGAPTLWELTTTRFTKQIKAGANAGQPTALSALISLYLRQVIVASEDEIETFLSPLVSRSRIRDVIHALLSARQLETLVIEGRTVLHIAGEAPAFTVAPPIDDIDFLVVTSEGDSAPATTEAAEAVTDTSPRITKFIPKPRKVGTGFVTKRDTKPPRDFEVRPTERERRPFTRERRPSLDRPAEKSRPTYTKPWEEERANRKPAASREGKRFDRKPGFVSKPGSGEDRPFKSNRPPFRRSEDASESRPPRRDFKPRPFREGAESPSDRPRRSFAKPGEFRQKREGFSGKPSFRRDGESRPPRRDFAEKREGFSGDRKPRYDRNPREASARGNRTEGPPYRKFDAPRKPRRDFETRPDRPDRPARTESSGAFPGKPAKSFGSKKPFTKSPSGFSAKARSGDFRGSPKTFAGKKPFSQSASHGKSASRGPGKPAGTFDKFKGNKKPFGKRPPARNYKQEETE
jgi:hypothetical protein